MSDQRNLDASVSVMLLRMQHKELLVPKAMMADVLSWKQQLFSPQKAQSAWKLGHYEWCDWCIPLICFESLIEPSFERLPMQKSKVVVLRSFQKGFEDDHYGLLCTGFPKPLILGERSMENLHVESNQDWIKYSISIGNRILDVPDFAALQGAVWATPELLSHSA